MTVRRGCEPNGGLGCNQVVTGEGGLRDLPPGACVTGACMTVVWQLATDD